MNKFISTSVSPSPILIALLFFSSISAHAEDLDRESLLKLLIGESQHSPSPADALTFYFAGPEGMIEIGNSEKGVSLNLQGTGNTQKNMGFFFQFPGGDEATLEKAPSSGGLSVLKSTQYFQNEGAREVYSTTEFTIQNKGSLNITAEKKVFWVYQSSVSDPSKWHFERVVQPKVEKAKIETQFVMSLSTDEITKLGQGAAASIREGRQTKDGHCSMESQSLMNCDWSLDTSYTPDTLHGVFSIKNGKIGELLKASLEYGC